MIGKWTPKHYHNLSRTLQWGKNLTNEERDALRDGEIFMLLDERGNPHSHIIMDSYGQIREGKIKVNKREQALRTLLGVP